MTEDEYQRWATYHAAIFPDFGQWWKTIPPQSVAELRQQFRNILRHISLPDALEASNRMLAGTVELCPGYERSMLASRIATAAREIAADRAPRRPESSYRYRPSQPGEGPTAGEIYREVLRRSDLGEDPVAVARELIPPVPPDREPRFKCPKCRDTGITWVWSNRAIRAALAGNLQPQDRGTMTVACECSLGDKFCLGDDATAPKGWRGWRQSARFNPDRYCRCNGSVHDPERIADFEEWVADYRANMTKQMSNYEPAFAEYNNR